jgi:hypothetical protein
VVVPVDAGRRNDSANGIGIVNKILAEGFARPEINFSSQVSYLGPPE